jgi:hypothetical protein
VCVLWLEASLNWSSFRIYRSLTTVYAEAPTAIKPPARRSLFIFLTMMKDNMIESRMCTHSGSTTMPQPTKAKPTITPPEILLAVCWEFYLFDPGFSITDWLTHSQNWHSDKERPLVPKSCWSVVWMNEHVEGWPIDGGAWHDISTEPLRVSIVPEMSVVAFLSQKSVPGRHMHWKFWQVQSDAPELWSVCTQLTNWH